jgi:hypothetical protein
VMTGSTAGARGDPVPASAPAAPPSSAVPAGPRATACGPAALAAPADGWCTGGPECRPAAGDTSARAHRIATTAGAAYFFKTNPRSVQFSCTNRETIRRLYLRQH